MEKTNNITGKMVDDFCKTFGGRYLSVNTLKNLNKRESQFHLFEHWNIIHIKDDMITHSYLNGGNGNIEKTFSQIGISEVGKVAFVKHKDTFILFKRKNGYLSPEYVYNELSTLRNVDTKRMWLNENGIQVRRKYWVLDESMKLVWKMQDVFTGKQLACEQ